MSKEVIAGISVAKNMAYLAVFEVRPSETKIIHLEEYRGIDSVPLWFLEKIIHPDTRILKKIDKVSVGLDPSTVLQHIFPMDTSLTQTEQNEHIHWELSNFIDGYHAKDYIYDLHILRNNARDQIADVLAVAVKRSAIYKIQDTLSDNKMDLHIADSSYFGAEQSLILNYPEIKSKTVALISASMHRADIGIESNGRLVKYGSELDPTPDSITILLRSLLTDVILNGVFMCGSKANLELRNSIKIAFDIEPIAMNPFRRTATTASFREYQTFAGKESLFAAATGVALRKL